MILLAVGLKRRHPFPSTIWRNQPSNILLKIHFFVLVMTISYQDFQKLEIKIGKVLSAERVPEADKLIKLVFDFGDEQRQIMAGIAEFIKQPADLVGKEMPVLINLEPRKLRGYVSEGMILAADFEGKPVLLLPEEEVPPGSVVR